jgi:hypothetical protein
VLDVGRDVFVVRIRSGQYSVVGMWLRVVPVQLLVAVPDFVAVLKEARWL